MLRAIVSMAKMENGEKKEQKTNNGGISHYMPIL
jgi:hypothetical protein